MKLENLSSSCSFPTSTFHGNMSEEEKETQFNSWLSDEDPAKWIISTTALLHGVDYPSVNAVIFIECPFGVYDFVQGAGRAGRVGQESLIVVLHNGSPPTMPSDNPYDCRPEMGRIIKDKSCRQLGVSKVMDGGEGLSCSQLQGSLLCDFCEGRLHPLVSKAIDQLSPTPPPQSTNVDEHIITPPPTQPTTAGHVSIDASPSTQPTAAGYISINTPPLTPGPQGSFLPRPPPRPSPAMLLNGYVAQSTEEARKQHAMQAMRLMDRFGGCFSCRIRSDGHVPCHTDCGSSGISGCSVNEHRLFSCCPSFPHNTGWMDWRVTHIIWPKNSRRCWFCAIPLSVVGPGHCSERGIPGKCRFSDTAVGAAWHVLHTPDLFRRLQDEMGFTPGADTKASFAAWLLERGSDREDVRILSVFLWLCEQLYPGCVSSV